jgi:hypothetical protein
MSARQSLDRAQRADAGSAKAQGLLLRRLWGDHVRAHLPALIVALAFMALEGGLARRLRLACQAAVR